MNKERHEAEAEAADADWPRTAILRSGGVWETQGIIVLVDTRPDSQSTR